MMTRRALVALAIASLSAACADSPVAPTTPTEPTTYTEYFIGKLAPTESQFFSFRIVATGTTKITLVGVTPADVPGQVLSTAMSLGVGTPVGTGCRLSTSVTAQPALVAQLSAATTLIPPDLPNIYCVEVQETGVITSPVTFTVRIVHP